MQFSLSPRLGLHLSPTIADPPFCTCSTLDVITKYFWRLCPVSNCTNLGAELSYFFCLCPCGFLSLYCFLSRSLFPSVGYLFLYRLGFAATNVRAGLLEFGSTSFYFPLFLLICLPCYGFYRSTPSFPCPAGSISLSFSLLFLATGLFSLAFL